MRSFPFRKRAEKGCTENHTRSASHGSQPDSSESHVNEQDTAIHVPSTQVRLEQGATITTQEKSDAQIHSDEHPEYPLGLKLATITVAVALSVFLVALVCTPE